MVNKLFWEQMIGTFDEMKQNAARFAREEFCDSLQNVCERTGKNLFVMIEEKLLEKNPLCIDVPAFYSVAPVYDDFEHYYFEFYGHYWLCFLAYLANQGVVTFSNNVLKASRLPIIKAPDGKSQIDWGWFPLFEYERATGDVFFLNDEDYINSACSASINLCQCLAGICDNYSHSKPGQESGVEVQQPESPDITEQQAPPVKQRKEPETPEEWIIWLHQRFVKLNEKRKVEGTEPLKFQGSRKIADFLGTKGFETSHTTVIKRIKSLREMGVLDDHWDVMDTDANQGDMRLDSADSNGNILRDHHSPGQRAKRIPEEEE